MKHTAYIPSEKKGANFFLLCLPVIAGIAAGSFFGTGSEPSFWLHQYFCPLYSGDTVLEVFRNTFAACAVFITAAFIAGLSAVGLPLGIAMLIYRGFGIGISGAVLYSRDGLNAVPEILTMLVPKSAAVVTVSVLAVRELIRLSGNIFSSTVGRKDAGAADLRLYGLKFAILIVFSIIISAADSAVNYIFSGLLH